MVESWVLRLTEISRVLKVMLPTQSLAGTLKHGREAHGVIFDGEKFHVIGGETSVPYSAVKNEVCTLKNLIMTCVKQPSELSASYAFYPALFLVAEDFGQDQAKC